MLNKSVHVELVETPPVQINDLAKASTLRQAQDRPSSARTEGLVQRSPRLSQRALGVTITVVNMAFSGFELSLGQPLCVGEGKPHIVYEPAHARGIFDDGACGRTQQSFPLVCN